MTSLFLSTLLFILCANSSAFALDFYGVEVTDRDVPSSFMKYGITGYRPTVISESHILALESELGFQQGDIILSINNKSVRKASEINQFSTDLLSVLVFSGSERKTLTINRLEIETKRAALIRTQSGKTALIKAQSETAHVEERQLRQAEEKPDNSPTMVFNDAIYKKKYGQSIQASGYNNVPATNRNPPKATPKKYTKSISNPRGPVYSSSGCEAGHWIQSVSDNGHIVILEDGTVWEVDAYDTFYSYLWLPASEIIVCDEKLINTDDNEIVSATRLR